MEENNNNLQIEVKPEIAMGCYSNLAIITHSRSEFILDFAAMLPGMKQPEVGSRILMTPEHAKRLYLALKENIENYESGNGPIDIGEMRGGFPIAPNGAKS